MRRKEKKVTDLHEIQTYMKRASICRLAFSVDNRPYIVPMSFGYDQQNLYFHCAKEGRKLDMLRANPLVCFEIEPDAELVKGEQACNWTMKFISIIGTGKASLIEEEGEKLAALNCIMKQYAPDEESFEFSPKAVQAIAIIKVGIEEMSCKKSGYA